MAHSLQIKLNTAVTVVDVSANNAAIIRWLSQSMDTLVQLMFVSHVVRSLRNNKMIGMQRVPCLPNSSMIISKIQALLNE